MGRECGFDPAALKVEFKGTDCAVKSEELHGTRNKMKLVISEQAYSSVLIISGFRE